MGTPEQKNKSKSKILKVWGNCIESEAERLDLISQLLYAYTPPLHQDAKKVIRVISMKNATLLGKPVLSSDVQ